MLPLRSIKNSRFAGISTACCSLAAQLGFVPPSGVGSGSIHQPSVPLAPGVEPAPELPSPELPPFEAPPLEAPPRLESPPPPMLASGSREELHAARTASAAPAHSVTVKEEEKVGPSRRGRRNERNTVVSTDCDENLTLQSHAPSSLRICERLWGRRAEATTTVLERALQRHITLAICSETGKRRASERDGEKRSARSSGSCLATQRKRPHTAARSGVFASTRAMVSSRRAGMIGLGTKCEPASSNARSKMCLSVWPDM